MNVGETVARSKKSKDIFPVAFKPPLQLNASKGNAENNIKNLITENNNGNIGQETSNGDLEGSILSKIKNK